MYSKIVLPAGVVVVGLFNDGDTTDEFTDAGAELLIASDAPILGAVSISLLGSIPFFDITGSFVLKGDCKLFFCVFWAFSLSFIPILATANVDIFLFSFLASFLVDVAVLC